jgi:hypothetical protein
MKNLQNRLGFTVTLARLAGRNDALLMPEQALAESKLAKEDSFCKELTEPERRWLRDHWVEFLEELDNLLDEPFELRCIGGFAAVAGYGLAPSTNDLDCCSVIPHSRVNDLDRLAGPSSILARKHKVHLHYAAVASIPESYDERLTEILTGRFYNIRLLIPDPYDLVLSKLTRNVARDREDVEYLAKAAS